MEEPTSPITVELPSEEVETPEDTSFTKNITKGPSINGSVAIPEISPDLIEEPQKIKQNFIEQDDGSIIIRAIRPPWMEWMSKEEIERYTLAQKQASLDL